MLALFNKIAFFFLFLFTLCHTNVLAQIVVIESSNLNDTTPGWSGDVNLDFYLTRSTSRVFTGNLGSSVKYQWKDQKIISLNNYRAILQLNKEKTEAENQAYQHFRYNCKINKLVTAEAFTQAQYDYVLKIDFRGLIGAGPLFNFLPANKNEFLLGTITMFEYEEERDTNIIHRDVRFSFYLSYNIAISKNTNLKLLGYYQPLIKDFEDYRISSSASFSTKITNKLRWFVNAALLYDAFPVQSPDIPQLTYSFRNGFNYSF